MCLKSETISVNFSWLSYITIHYLILHFDYCSLVVWSQGAQFLQLHFPFSSSCMLSGLFYHAWFCNSGKYWFISFQMFTHLIIQYQKITFICSATKPIRKVKKLASSWWWIQAFQNSNFHLKISLATNTVSHFLWSDRLTHFHDISQIPRSE